VIDERMAMPVPGHLSIEEAAAIPEVFLTAFQALRWLARLEPGEWALIHAGASGVGTAAIQIAREMGATPVVTASAAKHALCLELGAAHAIDYKTGDFSEEIRRITEGRGVDVIVDFIGAPYFDANLQALNVDGRLVVLALMGDAQAKAVHLGPILRKRLQITGSTLRNRSLDYKIALTREFREFAWPRFRSGALRPVVDRVFDWSEAAEAHRYMEENRNQGKIVLKVGSGKSEVGRHEWGSPSF
jgi:NADPH:quinone reductase-like Zn-dependent oxidoreductase